MSKEITSRAQDYSQWYNDLVIKGGLADYSAVRGCMVIKPYGYALWENMRDELDRMFKETGHQNAYFPLFVPKSLFEAEEKNAEGFAKECAVNSTMHTPRANNFFMASLFVGDEMAAYEAAAVAVVLVKSDLAIPSIDLPNERPAYDAVKATKASGITVAYAGMKGKGEDAYLRFIVHNGTSSDINYGAKRAEWPFPDVLVNGRPVPEENRCGSGMERYTIDPGMSAEFRIGPHEFEKVPEKGDLINVGFYLREAHAESGAVVFSEPFVLPPHFRRAIDQWHKMVESNGH